VVSRAARAVRPEHAHGAFYGRRSRPRSAPLRKPRHAGPRALGPDDRRHGSPRRRRYGPGRKRERLGNRRAHRARPHLLDPAPTVHGASDTRPHAALRLHGRRRVRSTGSCAVRGSCSGAWRCRRRRRSRGDRGLGSSTPRDQRGHPPHAVGDAARDRGFEDREAGRSGPGTSERAPATHRPGLPVQPAGAGAVHFT